MELDEPPNGSGAPHGDSQDMEDVPTTRKTHASGKRTFDSHEPPAEDISAMPVRKLDMIHASPVVNKTAGDEAPAQPVYDNPSTKKPRREEVVAATASNQLAARPTLPLPRSNNPPETHLGKLKVDAVGCRYTERFLMPTTSKLPHASQCTSKAESAIA